MLESKNGNKSTIPAYSECAEYCNKQYTAVFMCCFTYPAVK